MTAPTRTTRTPTEKQSGASIRRGGRNFMIAFYAALRAIKLYPLEHSAVQKAISELAQVAEELRREEGELEFRISGEFIFLNETRLRLDLSNYATFGHILTLAKLAGIGAIHVGTEGTSRDWQLLLSLIGAESKSAPLDRYKEIVGRLKEAIGVTEQRAVSKDGMFSYEEVECLGACEYAPMCRIDHRYEYDLTVAKIDNLVNDCRLPRRYQRSSTQAAPKAAPKPAVKRAPRAKKPDA
jgi:hypothetical protein